ncbi:hypothetical protein B0T22DRAFT_473268 [Podospora appendiculata]|uniref:Glycosyltransferase n=1 Tax=Podospora appendiculata TaxID=314037 RepID=A0AAE0WZM6_9PEZI|nr:hypothetical protein B0T22DRAFT_473268 [Podospora appendiculata]
MTPSMSLIGSAQKLPSLTSARSAGCSSRCHAILAKQRAPSRPDQLGHIVPLKTFSIPTTTATPHHHCRASSSRPTVRSLRSPRHVVTTHADQPAMLVSRVNAVFWLIWGLLFATSYFTSYDDPSSLFYNADRAYEQRFSRLRAAEADVFLSHVPPKPAPTTTPTPAADNNLLCIGIPSVNRTTESFLAYTLATLTDNLTPPERASIHIVVLLADRMPEKHFAYGAAWLETLADEILLYGTPPPTANTSTIYHTIPLNLHDGQPRGPGRVENMRLDHSALVEACRNRGARYFALVEDDIVASRAWFARLRKALPYVEQQAARTGRDWIYLRLFYSEIFMGWNSEEWLTYAETIVLVYVVVLLAFLETLRRRRRWAVWRKAGSGGGSGGGGVDVSRYTMAAALVFGLWMPALIVLYFLAGRLSVNRLNPLSAVFANGAGVREMPRYGCCAQGLVFPQRQLEGFQALLRDPPYHFAGDQILEGYADDKGLVKWALEPSVFQHVGLKESSDGPRRAEVWNFGFERLHSRSAGV